MKNIIEILSASHKVTREEFLELEKLAIYGDVEARFKLGYFYHKRRRDELDTKSALQWFELAAKSEHIEAQYHYANYLMQANSAFEAFIWYQKAAKQGYLSAQISIANMYKQGLGVKADKLEAQKWYEKAANQGDETAKLALKQFELTANDAIAG
ncbi:MAG: sel1 repeat family protein [Cardiobacteriaceae bacterium]|nr:sel1 repeat family protein [Cardiobacteriaceae bacterium]